MYTFSLQYRIAYINFITYEGTNEIEKGGEEMKENHNKPIARASRKSVCEKYTTRSCCQRAPLESAQ